MRANEVEAAIARYRKAGTKKDARNRNCAQMGSAYLGVLLYLYLQGMLSTMHPLSKPIDISGEAVHFKIVCGKPFFFRFETFWNFFSFFWGGGVFVKWGIIVKLENPN